MPSMQLWYLYYMSLSNNRPQSPLNPPVAYSLSLSLSLDRSLSLSLAFYDKEVFLDEEGGGNPRTN